MHKLFRHTTSYFFLAALLTLGGCVADEFEECPDAKGEGGWFTMTVNTLSASDVQATRAFGDGFEELGGTFAENYINLAGSDYRIYLIDDDNLLVCQLNPVGEINGEYNSNLATYANAELTFKLDKKQLDKITDSREWLSFRILMLANFKANGADYPTIEEGTSYSLSMLKAYEQRAFTASLDANNQWIPSPEGDNKRLIPFCGQQKFDIPRELMRLTSYDNPAVFESELPLMRAMAKIEVADCIDHNGYGITYEGDSKAYPYIEDVKLVEWQPKGYGVSTELSDNTPYLSQAWAWKVGASATPMNAILVEGEEWTGASGKIFRFYVPEIEFSATNTQLRFTVATHKDEGGNIVYKDVDMPVKELYTAPSCIIRNYIYRIEAKSSTTMIELDAEVQPWVIRKNNIAF